MQRLSYAGVIAAVLEQAQIHSALAVGRPVGHLLEFGQ